MFTCHDFLQVNVNGDISFGQPWSSPHPQPFPQTVPIIAPFWAGFDLNCENSGVFYRETTFNSEVATDIQSHLSLQDAFDPTLIVIATWNDTSYDGAHSDSSCDTEVNVVKEVTEMKDFYSVCMGTCMHDTVWYLLIDSV